LTAYANREQSKQNLINKGAKRNLKKKRMADGSLGEALGDAEVVGALARSGRAASLTALAADVDDIDAARGREYALLSALLVRAPDQSLLDRLANLSGDPTPLGVAHGSLAQAARRTNAERVEREYFHLFIGLGRGELLPYGSYYISGFLHERPLARLRAHLARLDIERAQGQAEPEDHAAILCEVMAGLANGALPAAAGADREVFEQHLAPWIGRFFADLERAEAADFYRTVGALGRTWIEIETAAFTLAKGADGARQKE
jgi:TorA maturation chaperone TorD